MVAVPLPLSVQLRPAGKAPVSLMAGAGAPVVLTLKLKGVPTLAVADAALVIKGAEFSVSVWEEVPARLSQFDSTPP